MKLRRLGAGILAGVCAIGLLGGCKSVTAEDLLKKSEEKAKNASYTELDMNLEVKVKVEAQGMTLTFPATVNSHLKSDKNMNLYYQITADASFMGADTSVTEEFYMTDGKMYLKGVTGDEWQSSNDVSEEDDTSDFSEKDLNDMKTWMEEFQFPKLDTDANLGKQEDINGVKAYKVTQTLTGDQLKEYIKELRDRFKNYIMEKDSTVTEEDLTDAFGDDSALDDLDLSQSTLTWDSWITEDGTLVKYYSDLSGLMNTMVNTLMGQMVESGVTGLDSSEDGNISFDQLELTGENIKLESDGSVSAPEDFSAE